MENYPALPGKAAIESWAIWFNVIVGVLVVVLQLPEVAAIIPPGAMAYVAAATAIGNALLRYFRTSAPITGVLKK